ncbi:MAG: SPASM domain-containing protein [Bacilli bacterium]|nr:SPASM domain-containing protein [Bacilli bacterium]
MEYKQSRFIIAQPYEDHWLLFSTLTCSLVQLKEPDYQTVFAERDYSALPDTVLQLAKMGFLVPKDRDELGYLKDLRLKARASVNGKGYFYLICPTMKCNARCFYCFENGIEKPSMSLETAEDVVQYILRTKNDGSIGIQWFGGEPLLGTKIIDYISTRLLESNVEFRSKIITNGYLLEEPILNRATSLWRTDIIQVTIDDIGQAYNKIKDYSYGRMDESPYDRVIRNVHLAGKKLKVRIRVNFNAANPEEGKRIAQTLRDEFASEENVQVYVAPIDSTDPSIPPITGSFKNKAKHPLIAFFESFEDYSIFGNPTLVQPQVTKETTRLLQKFFLRPITMPCLAACSSYVSIDALGLIYPCHRWLGKPEYSAGNVRDGIDESSHWWRFFSDMDIDDECASCPLLPMCQGGCKQRQINYGKEHSCTPIKGCAKEVIRLFKESLP